MTFGAAPPTDRADGRAVAWLLVATAGLAACITLLFLGMRAVMDIGGACADGGPFVPVQPCPEGVALVMPLGILGLFGFGALGFWAGSKVGGAWGALPLLAWPALFLSLGWNFLEFGLAPPPELEPDGGPVWGWLVPGVLFVLMGAVPLWVGWSARGDIRDAGSPAVARRFGMPGVGVATMQTVRMSPPTAEDVVDRLERLAALHRSGDLSDAEYDAAKAQLLGTTEEGST